jgi:hypothetical protein
MKALIVCRFILFVLLVSQVFKSIFSAFETIMVHCKQLSASEAVLAHLKQF